MKRLAITSLALSLAGTVAARAQDTAPLVITRAAQRQPMVAPAANFTGTARVRPLFESTGEARAYGASVSFDAGARTAWHSHPRGQLLIVTEGVGRVGRWGAPVEEIRPGDVVRIPPGAKHWHGAAPTSAMTHIAIVEPLDGRSTTWMEKVTDAQYAASTGARDASGAPARDSSAGAQPSAAQRLMGDVAPKARAAHGQRAVRRRLGAARALAARSQPGDRQRADRHESAGSAPVAHGPRQRERRHAGGDDRGDHPPRVLRRLAERGDRGGCGEGSVATAVTRALTRRGYRFATDTTGTARGSGGTAPLRGPIPRAAAEASPLPPPAVPYPSRSAGRSSPSTRSPSDAAAGSRRS